MGIGKSMFALQRYLILAKSGNNNTSCTYVFEILHQNTETKTPISIPGEIPRPDQRTKPELFWSQGLWMHCDLWGYIHTESCLFYSMPNGPITDASHLNNLLSRLLRFNTTVKKILFHLSRNIFLRSLSCICTCSSLLPWAHKTLSQSPWKRLHCRDGNSETAQSSCVSCIELDESLNTGLY